MAKYKIFIEFNNGNERTIEVTGKASLAKAEMSLFLSETYLDNIHRCNLPKFEEELDGFIEVPCKHSFDSH